MFRTIGFSAIAVLILAPPADAGVRNYFAPVIDGARLDACLTAGGECGKPVADAFCKSQGFETSVLFQREPVPATQTRRLGSGDMCESGTCTSFKQIKCISTNAVVAAAG